MELKSILETGVTSPTTSIIITGKIYTVDLRNPWPESILIEGSNIKYVGAKEKCIELAKYPIHHIQLDPKHLLMPGFVDSHLHPIPAGLAENGLKLQDCDNIEEVKIRITNYIKQNPNTSWIIAGGYYDSWFSDERKIQILDEVCPNIPLTIRRYDCHAYLCNSKALQKAKITNESEYIDSTGIIEKDKEGHLTGVLHESAMNLMRSAFPKLNIQEYEKGLLCALDIMIKDGITCFIDAAVKENHYKAYNEIYFGSKYKEIVIPRCSLSMCWNKMFFDISQLSEDMNMEYLKTLLIKDKSDKLRLNTVKIFVDGVLDSKTALLSEPYIDVIEQIMDNKGSKCACHGIANFTQEELNGIVSLLHQSDIQCHFHAIGDKAITMALNSIQKAINDNKKNGFNLRHFIAHLQVVNPKDFNRFKECGVSTTFSPIWFQEDSSTIITDKLLGEERMKQQYPIQDFAKAGVINSFGSDWPISALRPLDGLEVSITRQKLGGSSSGKPWHDAYNQCLTLEQAIRAYTLGGAYLAHYDKYIGSIEEGKKADLIILDRNLWDIKPTEIHTANILTTIIDGKIAHNKWPDYKFDSCI